MSDQPHRSAECGAEHPEYYLTGMFCTRPAGHEGPHAAPLWEEWTATDG